MGLAYIDYRQGRYAAAQEVFDGFFDWAEESRCNRREDWWPPFFLAATYAITGETDTALDELERAISLGYVDYRFLDNNPFFAGIRDARRYDGILSDLSRQVAKMRDKDAGGRRARPSLTSATDLSMCPSPTPRSAA